jgi:hypothetical protein
MNCRNNWPKNPEIGSISAREFIYVNGARLETFATGGYARGLRTREMERMRPEHSEKVRR